MSQKSDASEDDAGNDGGDDWLSGLLLESLNDANIAGKKQTRSGSGSSSSRTDHATDSVEESASSPISKGPRTPEKKRTRYDDTKIRTTRRFARRRNDFVIVTWNIWFSQYKWKERLVAALAETISHDPDVFCFQEVTTEVHRIMVACKFLTDRYQPTEDVLPCSYDCAVWVKRDPALCCIHSVVTIPLTSIYGRRGVLLDLEMELEADSDGVQTAGTTGNQVARIRVVTAHLESGKMMGTTRQRQLDCLIPHIKNDAFGQDREASTHIDAAFLVGDFNLDPSYPENDLVDNAGMDLWKLLRPDDAGFTEDTFINRMRYLAHGKHKQVRYDRIVMIKPSSEQSSTCPGCSLTGIELIGTESIDLAEEIWASDHFGVVAQVEFA